MSDKKPKRTISNKVIALGALLLLIMSFSLASSASPAPKANKHPAYMLAALHTSKETGNSPPSQATVKQFDVILRSLEMKCSEHNTSIISDYIVKAQELFMIQGKNVSLLEIAKNVDTSIPKDMNGVMSCKETVALLLTFM